MKYYITKFALTGGIKMMDGYTVSGYPNILKVELGSFHKPDWHETEEAAKKRAYEMKTAKLKSLNKAIDRINNLTF